VIVVVEGNKKWKEPRVRKGEVKKYERFVPVDGKYLRE
jgi:hypothetical protein